ncbi:hypothetical protein NQ314_006001 [Rhamnusium bicolor]|uniref:Major facilitator superfamily (MFS) profile domain-containing protein n=1 Tax=Rhamnusium bicolor TaxID=1586634 RepID=A0AAV8ZBV4_9CUCU|nr:hypothetical protein NQ314_006001 [Rhamnusium bicolor]
MVEPSRSNNNTIFIPECARSVDINFTIHNEESSKGVPDGVVFPSLHCLVARWAPPAEKGKFIGALLGGSLGTVITWPMLGTIIENLGWIWAFIISGILVLTWTILWIIFVSDSPDAHPRISDEEKNT